MKLYLVGGAVRDELLGREVTDFDYLAVGATIEEMEARYGKSVGMDFPVFLDRETGAQIAMARRERKTGSGYHGFAVEFDKAVTLEEDLKRRDLTINALAKDLETGEIVDCFGGLQDLENKILRHTSEAFAEDPLRVIRLARFQARYFDLGFSIAPETMGLAQDIVNSGELDAISTERYWLEIEKALQDGRIEVFFNVLFVLGVFSKVSFFKKTWGSMSVQLYTAITKIASVVNHPNQRDQLMFFTALTMFASANGYFGDEPLNGAPHALYDTLIALRLIRDCGLSEDKVFELLRFMKAWTQSNFFATVVEAVNLLNAAEYDTVLYPEEIVGLVGAVRAITSEPYRHLNGPEIGKAMEQARHGAVKQYLQEIRA